MFWFLPFNRWGFPFFLIMVFPYLFLPSSFDATYLYHYTFILLCNLVFTSLPVIVLGGMS